MNSAGASPGNTAGGSVGINFAIPIDLAMSEAKEIMRTGTVTHPSIGLIGFSVTEEMKAATGLPRGVYLEALLPGSPAATAGMRHGDVITEVNGHAVPSLDDFLVAIREAGNGASVRITYSRGGSAREATVRVVDASTLGLVSS
jgi:putative serine protease PepD